MELVAAGVVQSTLILEFRQEFVDSVLRVAVLSHVNQIQQLLDADEDPKKEKLNVARVKGFNQLTCSPSLASELSSSHPSRIPGCLPRHS